MTRHVISRSISSGKINFNLFYRRSRGNCLFDPWDLFAGYRGFTSGRGGAFSGFFCYAPTRASSFLTLSFCAKLLLISSTLAAPSDDLIFGNKPFYLR